MQNSLILYIILCEYLTFKWYFFNMDLTYYLVKSNKINYYFIKSIASSLDLIFHTGLITLLKEVGLIDPFPTFDSFIIPDWPEISGVSKK